MMDIEYGKLIENLSKKLISYTTPPTWSKYVKTGHGKQRPPVREDWWYIRAASVLLSVQKLGPVGVSKLSVKYGNRKNKGYKPEKEARGSRNLLRKMLQNLETNGLIKQSQKDVHKGRIITVKGIKLISEAVKEAKLEQPKIHEPRKEKLIDKETTHETAQVTEKKKPKKKE